ncbi:alpha/beta fold hydrolase [Nocardia asteroides]|uniref:Hydrolase n=1 Tax=Nocardia asteroides NBRC 15531 TaxID=1110697 RepID=U5EER2_NOCAS|nr:alpha/beta hydrolase [Nocardia asteroides]TLF69592.1 alpha/beta hydrolase [Nocardia asteroides NBRC 15531]UGT49094.1 alpha/beta hydrolase [Nocardia asteroides]SFL80116.1 Pimeloyl-ACP methyl ester carboxylesterase [Nocardia asteroides]VEG31125.1 3-oxoadipate enol-lactonase 2 [Nocardia asteroides]GAD83654.1 putative hydrolase [Nocardia asteroides NBRC 15531]
MRAKLPTALAKWIDTASTVVETTLAAHRADLRTRTHGVAAFDPPSMPAEVIPVVTADGARLRVHAYGPVDAPVIVFAHGWTCSIEYWNAQINAFAGEYRVIAYDQRGHGESTNGYARPSTDLLADDLCDVLDAVLLPGQRAVLVGHSMGGMTLIAWAGRYPERVAEQAAAVVLTNTGAHSLVEVSTMVPGLNKPLRLLRGRQMPTPDWLGRLILGTPVVFPPIKPVRWIFARQVMTLDTSPEKLNYALSVVRGCPMMTRARYGLLLAELHLGDVASNFCVPTTVLAGDRDDMTPALHAERLAELLDKAGTLAGFKVLPTGHLGNVERYDLFNAELRGVLAAVREPARALA